MTHTTERPTNRRESFGESYGRLRRTPLSLISYLPATSYCLRLRSARFSYLSELECTFGKDDPPQLQAPVTSRTAHLFSELGTILSLLLFTVPGVIAGGQIGSAVARYIPQGTMTVGMGILFTLVAALLLGEVIPNVR